MKPLIGITLATPPGKTREEAIEAGARYLQAVQEAGGASEVIIAPDPADDRAAVALAARLSVSRRQGLRPYLIAGGESGGVEALAWR